MKRKPSKARLQRRWRLDGRRRNGRTHLVHRRPCDDLRQGDRREAIRKGMRHIHRPPRRNGGRRNFGFGNLRIGRWRVRRRRGVARVRPGHRTESIPALFAAANSAGRAGGKGASAGADWPDQASRPRLPAPWRSCREADRFARPNRRGLTKTPPNPTPRRSEDLLPVTHDATPPLIAIKQLTAQDAENPPHRLLSPNQEATSTSARAGSSPEKRNETP